MSTVVQSKLDTCSVVSRYPPNHNRLCLLARSRSRIYIFLPIYTITVTLSRAEVTDMHILVKVDDVSTLV
ncbi:hypothetical protein E4T56_gene12183 [Termitomyces sp. T112]|nr:hypothetical protein E4T56_gene12183 [Termitomyces sp. T112]